MMGIVKWIQLTKEGNPELKAQNNPPNSDRLLKLEVPFEEPDDTAGLEKLSSTDTRTQKDDINLGQGRRNDHP